MKFDLSSHVRAISALVTKLENAERKADENQRSIGQHIAAMKKERPNDCETIVKAECNLGRRRAYELLTIADGTKTVEQVRAANTEGKRKERKRESVTSRTERPLPDIFAIAMTRAAAASSDCLVCAAVSVCGAVLPTQLRRAERAAKDREMAA